MRCNLWYKILNIMSVFDGIQLPKVIYETDSPYNGHIQVVQIGNTLKIKVDKFEQSISHDSPATSRLVWGKTVDLLKEETPELKKVLILGLGGGTMAKLISLSFPGSEIISVDIDQIMYDVARAYFGVDQIPNHRVIIDDALRVVVQPEKYDLTYGDFDAVIVDIYVGEKYPDLGKSGNFVAALKRLTKHGGLLIFNRIYLEYHQDEVNTFIDYVSEFLKDVKCTIVAGYTNSDNILIAGNVE